MTTAEFSNEFDVLLNAQGQPLIFDEYEKSIFLTEAQEEVITELYSGKLLDGFEGTEQIRKYLNSLVEYKDINLAEGYEAVFVPQTALYYYKIDFNTIESLKNLMFITYESANFNDTSLGCRKETTVQVIPARHDELVKIVKNPFRGPNTSRVLRLDTGNKEIELITKYKLSKYYVGFLSKPSPIILVPLSGGLTIDGVSAETTCKLNPILHRTIVQMAVSLALASKKQNK